MGILDILWRGRREIDHRLGEVYKEEEERLMEICAPYKVQSDETPYFQREEVVDSKIKLWELEEKKRRLRERYRFLAY